MFEHLTIKWIVGFLVVGVVIYMVTLFFDEDGRSIFKKEPVQTYVTAQVDSTIAVRRLNPLLPEKADTVYEMNLKAMVAKVDSDSLTYDLYRHQQAVVTIDLSEHKEHVFFTWEDVKAYFAGVLLTIENFKKK